MIFLPVSTELAEVVATVTAKIEAACGADNYPALGRWDAVILVAKVDEDVELLEMYGRLVRASELPQRIAATPYSLVVDNDPLVLREFAVKARLTQGMSLSDTTTEHFDAFWLLQEAVGRLSGNDADRLYALIFEDPTRAPLMSAIVRDRGIVDQDTMRGLLDAVDNSGSIMLAEGVL